MPQGVCSNHGDGPNSEARGGNVDDEKTGDADRGSVESSNEIKKEDRGVSNSCSRSGRCPDSQRDQTICGSQLGMGCADTDKQSSTGTEHVPEDSKHKHVTGEIGSVCTNGSHTASTNESGSANATDSVDVKCTADDTRGTQRKRNKMTNSQKNIKQLTTWHMLIKIAEDENRIILTKNRRLAQAHANVSAKKGFNTPDTMKYQAAYFVSASDKYGQRREIVERFGLNIRERLLLTRCLTCNGTFDGPYSGHELDVSSVPTPEVLTVEGRVFYKCIGSCGAATWQGGQFTNHIAKLRLEYGDPNNVLPVEQDF
ncbi:hypothetical protein, variant [Sphaeroforma arctica JP610]|nr:hypothetical protein, variant [Sphaeroforma arctica JP610]KNC85808.1 hypothetical protein, variant [Sphaeroforma arctica JP610]|eukprot:XP_014159710.1 hypothetical protein, variant [Sphaeroforma arctica JP610]